MIKDPATLCRKLGLAFNDPQLFVTALSHRSIGANNNERLEFLGDSILGFVIAQRLYDAFPDAAEGTLSRLRASIVNETSLAEVARTHNLGDYLVLGSGELKSGGYRRDSILSDALEAIIGALFKDQGIAACQSLIGRLFDHQLQALSADNWQKDPEDAIARIDAVQEIGSPRVYLDRLNRLAA